MASWNGLAMAALTLGALAVAWGARAAPPDGDKLHVAAAPEDFKALGIGPTLQVPQDRRRTRPAPGHMRAGNKFFAGVGAGAGGGVGGPLTGGGVPRQAPGSGYHDQNGGNVSPADLFDNWWWGRGKGGSHPLIIAALHGTPAV